MKQAFFTTNSITGKTYYHGYREPITREEMIAQAVEVIAGSMQEMGTPDEEIRAEAEKLTDDELKAFLQEEEQ